MELTTRSSCRRPTPSFATGPFRFVRSAFVRNVVFFAAVILVGGATAASAWASPRPIDPIESGRKALNGPVSSPPWYDRSADRVAPVQPPKSPRRPRLNLRVRTPATGPSLFTILVLVAIFAIPVLVVIAYFWLRDREADTGRPSPAKAPRRRHLEDLPEHIDTTIDDWEAAIREAVARGDYRRAVVLLFGYELIELDKHDRIRLERGKTNRQYLRELRGMSYLRKFYEDTMMLFEEVYYGNRDADPERFRRYYEQLPQFLEAAAATR
ncbi:MAG: DUF4129 domain-containing protein [Planctomycetota bacterium]|nr:MAG: DUF4129 domain-containing protein [Planctomycetota bacterium]